ncbi:MAG TPA: hypothetical protein VNE16_06335 [Vicinamibacterales bacterium]|nr:hypothetical protein [Vicinamibacterales bacterium]
MQIDIPAFGHYPNSSFLGFPMSQNRHALAAWNWLLEAMHPSTLIEIGTSVGGFSALMALAAANFDALFVTYDINDMRPERLRMFTDAAFRRADCFDRTEEIGALIQRPGTTYVFCDGGDKVRELQTFSAFLKPGDVIGAHDYACGCDWPWAEIRDCDVEPVAMRDGLEKIDDLFDRSGWIVMRKH